MGPGPGFRMSDCRKYSRTGSSADSSLRPLRLALVVMIAASLLVLCSACAPAVTDQDVIPAEIDAPQLRAVRNAQEAMAAFNRGRYIDAALGFHLALAVSPHARNLKVSLAATYDRLGLPSEAISRYEQLLAEDPLNPFLLAGKAHALASEFRYTAAIDTYQQALDIYLDRGEVGPAAAQAQSLSALFFLLGNVQDAVCLAGESAKMAPSRPAALRYLRLLIAAGRVEAAENLLTAIREDPSASADPLVLMALAQVSYSKGNLEDAELLLTRALRTRPPDPTDALELEFFKEATVADLAKKAPPSEEEEEEAEDDEDSIRPDANFLLARALYWPALAQISLAEIIESEEEES